MKSKALIACSVLVAGLCAAAAEYRPEAWNLQAREKSAETDGVFSGMPVAANMRRWKMVMSQDRKSIRIVPPGLMVIVK